MTVYIRVWLFINGGVVLALDGESRLEVELQCMARILGNTFPLVGRYWPFFRLSSYHFSRHVFPERFMIGFLSQYEKRDRRYYAVQIFSQRDCAQCVLILPAK